MKVFFRYILLCAEGFLYLASLAVFYASFEYGFASQYLMLLAMLLVALFSVRLSFFKVLKSEASGWRRGFNVISQIVFWTVLSMSVLFPIIPEQFPGQYFSIVLLIGIVCVLGLVVGLFLCRFSTPWYLQLQITAVSLALLWQSIRMFSGSCLSDLVVISAPVRGEWFVMHGGCSLLINHHYHVEPQRFSIDLVRTSDLAISDGINTYASFGSEVYSPTDGHVVSIVDHMEDDGVFANDSITSVFGNHIVIQDQNTGLFVVLAHLMKDSILLEVGASVESGELIAKCGNSGNSSQPHLHLQIQSSSVLMGEGTTTFPISFGRMDKSVGGDPITRGRPLQRGDIISSFDD